jgi:hypothetical protein
MKLPQDWLSRFSADKNKSRLYFRGNMHIPTLSLMLFA